MDGAQDNFEERFQAYLDEELAPDERLQFEQQLQQDPQLAASFRQYRATVEILKRLPAVAVPPDFGRQVQKRIRAHFPLRETGIAFGRRLPFLVLGGMLMLAMFFPITLLLRDSGQPSPEPIGRRATVIMPAEVQRLVIMRKTVEPFGPFEWTGLARLRIRVPADRWSEFRTAVQALVDVSMEAVRPIDKPPAFDVTLQLMTNAHTP